MLEEVTLREIEAILAVTDRMGVHREAVVIPLMPRTPGRIRRMPGGKVEIVVDAQAPFDEFVAGLEPRIREALEGSLDRPATGLPGIGRGSGLR